MPVTTPTTQSDYSNSVGMHQVAYVASWPGSMAPATNPAIKNFIGLVGKVSQPTTS